jgi:hypothetical protein
MIVEDYRIIMMSIGGIVVFGSLFMIFIQGEYFFIYLSSVGFMMIVLPLIIQQIFENKNITTVQTKSDVKPE